MRFYREGCVIRDWVDDESLVFEAADEVQAAAWVDILNALEGEQLTKVVAALRIFTR
jgi:hypothetical protein